MWLFREMAELKTKIVKYHHLLDGLAQYFVERFVPLLCVLLNFYLNGPMLCFMTKDLQRHSHQLRFVFSGNKHIVECYHATYVQPYRAPSMAVDSYICK